MAFEGLNHAGVTDANLLVVLNDNAIGIDPSVGALKQYLTNVKKGTQKRNNIIKALNFDYFHEVFDTYSCLKKLCINFDICSSDDKKLNDYKIVFAPSLFLTNNIIENCSAHLVLGPRFNSKTKDFQIPNPLPPNVSGLNVVVERVETIRQNMSRRLKKPGSVVRWIEDISHDASVIEETECGDPIVLQQNNKTYLAGCLDQEAKKRLFKKLLKDQWLIVLPVKQCMKYGFVTLRPMVCISGERWVG